SADPPAGTPAASPPAVPGGRRLRVALCRREHPCRGEGRAGRPTSAVPCRPSRPSRRKHAVADSSTPWPRAPPCRPPQAPAYHPRCMVRSTEHIPMAQPLVTPCLEFMAGKRTGRQPGAGAW
ncbi:unnamed protein product, partial [Urochloa humidicola]